MYGLQADVGFTLYSLQAELHKTTSCREALPFRHLSRLTALSAESGSFGAFSQFLELPNLQSLELEECTFQQFWSPNLALENTAGPHIPTNSRTMACLDSLLTHQNPRILNCTPAHTVNLFC